jgi:hypothetical protein
MPRDPSRGSLVGPESVSDYFDAWEDIVAATADLPRQSRDDGLESAIVFARNELRPAIATLGVSRPASREEAVCRKAIGLWFERGLLELLCEDSLEGERERSTFLAVVANEYFETGVRAVFERVPVRPERPYEPQVSSSD